MEHLDDIRAHRIVIAVAGMEGAIFSVLAGLVRQRRDRGARLRSATASPPAAMRR